MTNESTAAFLATVQAAVAAMQTLFDSAEPMQHWANSTFLPADRNLLRSYITQSKNNSELYLRLKEAARLRVASGSMTNAQKNQLSESLKQLSELEEDMGEVVEEFKMILRPHGNLMVE